MRVRSALFVPASRPDFLARAADRGADAVIVDLEDSVPPAGKEPARQAAARWLRDLDRRHQPVALVRVNGDGPDLDADLAAVVGPGLDGVLLPKVRGADDVVDLHDRLSWLEGRAGVARGTTLIWPLLENAAAIRDAYAIATASGRVTFLGGAVSAAGDLERDLGLRVTPTGAESLFLRSKVLVDARAAGIANPVSGLMASLADDTDVEAFAVATRDLGYDGMMVLHPRHVPIVNRTFGATAVDLESAAELIERFEQARANGHAVIVHQGTIVDEAGYRTAIALCAEAARVGR